VDSLEVLRCKQCDAPLALADADTVTCPSCKTINDVPATYRELHRARIADAAARDQAEHVLRSLDTPPSTVVKVLARTFDQNMFAFLVFFGAPVMLWAVLLALRADDWIARHFHYASGDDVPFGYTAAIMLTALFVFVFVPRVFGVYANRRVADRGHLLAALAARPPKVPGAASQCRMCGAPLAIEPDKILAVCSYCRAENAVHLETKLVADTSAGTATIGREVSTAATRDREERKATRRLLRHELGRYLLRTVLIGGAFVLGCQEDANRHPTTLSIIGIVAALALFAFFLIRSMMTPDEDAHERRASNDMPGWVGIIGPIVVLVLLAKAC
jgi:phage FluMu protein Com